MNLLLDVIEFHEELNFARKLMIQFKPFFGDCNGKYDNIFDVTIQMHEFKNDF